MYKVIIIPKTPGPKHQEYFNKAEDARWYAKMRRSSGDCWIVIEREDYLLSFFYNIRFKPY